MSRVLIPSCSPQGTHPYRSSAQAAAIRSVLSMPAGAALAVDLPTGEGKSTVFKVIATVGFAASPSGQAPGLVVVVVPTVTLALDHERTCGGNDAAPFAYIGGREGRNELIRSAIESGSQRILFAAPESIAQSLRLPLARVASAGRLGAVVIDEAHLVDAWGTGFRTEFQTLAGLLNAWKTESPQAFDFRTVFLSATLTDASLQTLQDLFSPEVPVPVFSGASVRPEPEYWVASPVDSATRRERVDEALRHLPRPLILYVTKVADAEMWHGRLRGQGYSRVAMVHGGTSSEEREQILRGWTEAAIDVVVATSAFGLGIDYPHVRSVVHACLPETFDRFYQEVGWTGRDGCASISLLVPDFNDAQIARSLSAQKVITVERGLVRWRSMFQHPLTISEGYPRYVIPLDVPPGYDVNDIDLVGERSTDWNQRTLALMARAGLIRLLGACTRQLDPQNSPQQFERIEVRNEKHLHLATWQAIVEPARLQIMEKSYEAFVLLKRFGTGRECPATLVGEMYSGPGRQVALRCSGCRVCREDPKSRIEDGSVAYKRPPWPIQAQLAPSMKHIWGDSGYAVVTYPTRLTSTRAVRDFVDGLRRLDTFGLRIWVGVGDIPEWMLSSVDKACAGKPWVTLSSSSWAPMIWPEGAQIVACGEDAVPDTCNAGGGRIKAPSNCASAGRCARSLAAIARVRRHSARTHLSI